MGAVSSTEGVVDVAICIAGQLLHEFLLGSLHNGLGGLLFLVGGILGQSAGLAFFLCVETEVLQEEGLTGLQGSGLSIGLLAVIGKLDGNAQAFAYATYNVLQGELGIYLLGTAQVAHDNHRTSGGKHLLKGGHGTADTGVVRDLEVFVKGNVEVYAYDGFFAGEIVLVNELLHGL